MRKFKLLTLLFTLFVAYVFATRAFADGQVSWTGNGTTNRSLDTVQCDENNTPYIFWVFTPGGNNSVTAATVYLGGSGSGSYPMNQPGGGAWQVSTGYYDLSTLTAYVSYVGGLGSGNSNLVISHGCPGTSTTPTPTLTLTPTVTPTPTQEPCNDDEEECVTPTPTQTPSETPTPTPEQSVQGSSDGDGLGCSTHDCSSHPTQAVLGASTSVLGLSSTDSTNANLNNVIAVLASLSLLGGGFVLLRKNA